MSRDFSTKVSNRTPTTLPKLQNLHYTARIAILYADVLFTPIVAMTDHIDAIETTDQPTRSDECPHQRQLTDQSLQLADQIQATDPERANAIKEIWPKVAVVIANAGDGYNLKEISELKVIEKFFTDAKITTKQLKNRNTMLSYPATRENTGKQIIQVIDEIYKHAKKVDEKAKEIKNNDEHIEKQNDEKEQLRKTIASQSATLTAHPDLAHSVSSATDLDISPTDTPETKAEKQAKQEQVAQQLWTTTAELDAKLKSNSQYSEAWLSIGQLLSFLQTEQALYTNQIDDDPFLGDINTIRNDLGILPPTPHYDSVFTYPATFEQTPLTDLKELPAQNLANISTEQIKSHDNFADFVQYQEVPTDKTDYTTNDLAPWLETELHGKLPTNPDIDNHIALLNRNSPLTAQQAQTLHDTQATINTHRNTFKNDIANDPTITFDLPDDFTQLSQPQKQTVRTALVSVESATHPTELQAMKTALWQRLAIYQQHGRKIEAPDPVADAPAGRVKLAKTLGNTIRTETTKTFLGTVADSMTTMIGGLNTGAKAKIETETKKRNLTYSQIPFL